MAKTSLPLSVRWREWVLPEPSLVTNPSSISSLTTVETKDLSYAMCSLSSFWEIPSLHPMVEMKTR